MDDTKLIAALEGATGPDRELDVAIAKVKGWQEYIPNWFTPPSLTVKHHKSELPHYTASIDAALTLLPAHRNLSLNIGPSTTHVVKLDWPGGFVTAVAPTPALAICIAALRAREARPQVKP